MKNRRKKTGVAVAAASVITAGVVTAAVAYQNGMNFEPKNLNRKLQNNQVVFSDDKDQVEHTKDDNGDNSELWKKIRMMRTMAVRKRRISRTICFSRVSRPGIPQR